MLLFVVLSFSVRPRFIMGGYIHQGAHDSSIHVQRNAQLLWEDV